MQLIEILEHMDDLNMVTVQDGLDTCLTNGVVWMKNNLNEKDLTVDVLEVSMTKETLTIKVIDPLDYMQAANLNKAEKKQYEYENDIARMIKERNRLLINSTVKNLKLTPEERNTLYIMVDDDFKAVLHICNIIDKARYVGLK